MLILDPVLSGVPPTIFIDASPAVLAAPTPAMLADTRSVYRENVPPFRWYRSNGTALIELGSASPGTVSNFVYTGGNLTSVVANGVQWTYTYNANGDIATMTAGGVTRAVSYTPGGDIDSVS